MYNDEKQDYKLSEEDKKRFPFFPLNTQRLTGRLRLIPH